jgi:hypothetical protein
MRRLIAAITGGAVLLLLAGCAQVPKVDVTPTVKDDRVVFAIQVTEGEIDGVHGFEVQDENGRTLWDVNLTYGVLPTDGNMPAEQKFPPNDEAPPDIRGKTVKVILLYGYQHNLTLPLGMEFKTLQIPQKGNEQDVSPEHREPPSPAEGAAPKYSPGRKEPQVGQAFQPDFETKSGWKA